MTVSQPIKWRWNHRLPKTGKCGNNSPISWEVYPISSSDRRMTSRKKPGVAVWATVVLGVLHVLTGYGRVRHGR
jgi:hypothetical protein